MPTWVRPPYGHAGEQGKGNAIAVIFSLDCQKSSHGQKIHGFLIPLKTGMCQAGKPDMLDILAGWLMLKFADSNVSRS